MVLVWGCSGLGPGVRWIESVRWVESGGAVDPVGVQWVESGGAMH